MSKRSKEELLADYRKILNLVERKEPNLARDVMRVPVSDYTDRDRWEREVQLFRTTPMLLAFSGELAGPGSYWAMTRVGVPLLLTRDREGKVHLFINACRHRGALVVEEGRGQQPRFSCIYHAWTYGLDGKLLSVASSETFGLIDKSSYGLAELAVEEREGAIWGMLTPGLPLDLDSFLGSDLNNMLNKIEFADYRPVEVVELPASNWKLAWEGNCESYHFNSLHAKSFGGFTYPNILHWTGHGLHSRNMTPALGIESCDPTSIHDLQRYVQVSYLLFPSTIFSFASDTAFAGKRDKDAKPVSRMFFNQVLPGNSPDTSITISRTMVDREFAGTPIEEETRHWARMSHDTVLNEDCPVVIGAQKTLLTGAQEFLTMGRNEITIHHFHNSLRKVLGEPMLSEYPLEMETAELVT